MDDKIWDDNSDGEARRHNAWINWCHREQQQRSIAAWSW